MGDTDAAFADFSTLIEMDPYYTDYLCERAKISRLAGDFAGALADYDRAVQLTPPFPELYYNRGTAKAALGDVAGALADFSFVLDIVISRVLRLGMLPVERPLIFYQGGYGRFEAAESAALR